MIVCVTPLDVLRMAEKHILNQKLLREFHAQPWQDVVGCIVPKHHDTYKIFALAKNICNYGPSKGKLELGKETIFFGFRPTTNLMWDPSTCTHSSQQKDHHPYIRKESCVAHHGLHRREQIPHCGIVEVPV
jgi:hypothetical protein